MAPHEIIINSSIKRSFGSAAGWYEGDPKVDFELLEGLGGLEKPFDKTEGFGLKPVCSHNQPKKHAQRMVPHL